jgi:hypothetical protein
MKNIEIKIEGDQAIIKIDLSKEFGLSKSGKSQVIATSEGNVSIGFEDVKMGLNVYRPAK